MKPAARDQLKLPVIGDDREAPSRKLWRSLEEKEPSPQTLAARADEFPKDLFAPVDRRVFLQWLGGTAAVAGAAACWRPPDENIYPYTRAPDNLPGVPVHYATALQFDGFATGVVVESYDGRPIKVEGNAGHPNSLGAATAFEQAELCRFYDPNRSKAVLRKGKPLSWRTAAADLALLMDRQAGNGGARVRFLVEANTSPTIAAFREQIRKKLPQARFYSWSPVSRDNARRGAAAAFGAPVEARYDLTRADVIVSLDSDFMTWEPERLRLAREFADRRVPENGLNRLYCVESMVTVTGMNADHRLRARPTEVGQVANALAHALGTPGLPGGAPQLDDAKTKWVRAVAQDLLQHAGRSVVVAGFRQPPAVHALAHAMNASLGNIDRTVTFAPVRGVESDDGPGALRRLADEIKRGAVDTLVIDAWNPVFSAPGDLDFAAAVKAVPNSIYFAYYDDETARSCNFVIPRAHEFESWGDTRGPDGTAAIIQPLIAPLWGAVAAVNFWAAFVGQGIATAHDLVKALWAGRAQDAAGFEEDWKRILAMGVVANSAEPPAAQTLNAGALAQLMGGMQSPQAGALELNIIPDYRVYDGRFANVAWLEELPDPITKVTWENTATVSPATAERLGLETGSRVQLTVGNRSVEAPIYVLPGHADEVVTVSLGHGWTAVNGDLAGRHGFNAYPLRTIDRPWFTTGLKLEDTGRRWELAITQDHGSMEGRDMAISVDVTEKTELREVVHRNRETITPDQVMQPPVDYSQGYKWGMAIDLGRCIGCNACVVACQAENNIPIVGKEQVIKAREMHWLMIDRYFVGDDAADPEIVLQPRMCVHCETAPCEYVCPVNATVHSDEGLNDMVYNRCVGTRYCSNNCPYKVRRFNYLHFSAGKALTEKMMMNPDVTVRARGVMEKCTYCVQRIERVRIQTRIEGRTIKDGEIVTACQQTCPAQAIIFGDLNDPNAKVAKLHADARRYDLLYSLGTRPRTGYLARIRNLNPALAPPKPAAPTEHH